MDGLWVISIVVMAVSAGISHPMNENLKQNNPLGKPYMWGYFLGVANSILWLLFSIFAFASETNDALAFGILFLIMACISVGYIFRNRWWAVAATIIQFNPIIWIINAIYLRNRWHELKGLDTSFATNAKPSSTFLMQHSEENHTESPTNHPSSEKDLTFKDTEAAFDYCCRFMTTDLEVGNGIPAIVLDAEKKLGAKQSVPINTDGFQQAYIRVASDDGGFKTVANARSKLGPKLNSGDFVMWVPSKYSADIGKKFKDQRIGWIGSIAARLEPTVSLEKGWKVDEIFRD